MLKIFVKLDKYIFLKLIAIPSVLRMCCTRTVVPSVLDVWVMLVLEHKVKLSCL